MATKSHDSFGHKMLSGYRFIAMTLLSSLAGLVLLNAILFFVFPAKDEVAQNPIWKKYDYAKIIPLYPNLSKNEIEDLIREMWSRPHEYAPFTEFKERPYRGRYVNVSDSGFRIIKNQGPWPPQSGSLNIFLFGGSTTFGFGVEDNQTIASHLQEALAAKLGRDVRLYNFGCANYFSTQERILYEQLLISGIVPDLAVFIDGLNEFYMHTGEPRYTERLRTLMNAGQPIQKTSIGVFVGETALGRAAQGLRSRLIALVRKKETSRQLAATPEEKADTTRYIDPVELDQVLARYRANKRLIEAVSKNFGVQPFFVWQPVPSYKYEQRYHRVFQSADDRDLFSYAKYGYERMSKIIEKEPPGSNFFWCADIQQDAKEPLYVDAWHYSQSFSKHIAAAIADFLVEQHVVARR
jgi:hypothetical protein